MIRKESTLTCLIGICCIGFQPVLLETTVLPKAIALKDRFPIEEIRSTVIHFPLASTRLENEALARIQGIADLLNRHDDVRLKLSGYTDPTGSDALNHLLSESRARTVWLQLVDSGVDPERIDWRLFADCFMRIPLST